jgi:hypothetical protein
MGSKSTLMEQIQRNTVALISLAVAVTSLGYNTWRNEASEYNRNQRLVAIELLLMLGDLQQLTLDKHYGADVDGSAILRQGWSKVLTIRDLAQIAAGSVPSSASALYTSWDANNHLLGTDVVGKERIIVALEGVRSDVHALLKSLD